jgi:hypothetical protein
MEWVSKEFIDVVYTLVPGFLAAWIFFGLTAHPRKSPFERVVQALIFMAFIKPMLICTEIFLVWFAAEYMKKPFGDWNENVAFVYSLLLATGLGLFWSVCSNNDFPHKFLRHVNVTSKTSFPTEWYRAFHKENLPVVLHLVGPNGRRLYGFPEEWPDHPKARHFVIGNPHWLIGNQAIAVHRTKKILVRSRDVEMVEFVYRASQYAVPVAQIEAEEKLLAEAKQAGELAAKQEAKKGADSAADKIVADAIGEGGQGSEHKPG